MLARFESKHLVEWAPVSQEIGSGEFLMPTAVICGVAWWHWMQEVKAKSFFAPARPFATGICAVTGITCLVVQGITDFAPRLADARSTADITYVALSAVGVFGTVGVMATSGKKGKND